VIAPDVNLLLYAYNPAAKLHVAARRWLETELGGEELVGFPGLAVHGFLRLATNPRVFPEPLSPQEAVEAVEAWLARPNAALIEAGPEHWATLRHLIIATSVRGGDISDAALAAIVIEHGAELHSTDRDFARFPGLKWKNPLED